MKKFIDDHLYIRLSKGWFDLTAFEEKLDKMNTSQIRSRENIQNG